MSLLLFKEAAEDVIVILDRDLHGLLLWCRSSSGTIAVVVDTALHVGNAGHITYVDYLSALVECLAYLVVAMRAGRMSGTPLDADNVSTGYEIACLAAELAEMSVVIEQTVRTSDADILAEALRVVARVLPTCIVYCTGDGRVYLFAVDTNEVKTVVCRICGWAKAL